ncbi:MAG: TatD family hydrolase [bacterium]|nr:TatD family hydrolase [bacterium]
MLVDSHAHLNFKAYNDDLSDVIGRCRQSGLKVINVGAAYESSQKAVALALAENDFYASIGLHPVHAYDEEFKTDDYQTLIDSAKGKVVAIGETGLDYWHLNEYLEKGAKSIDEVKEKQEKLFRQQIKLAKDNNLPLIIHTRKSDEHPDAYDDLFDILKNENMNKGVVHCYVGDMERAKKFVKAGFYLGFTGIVTFEKKSEYLQEIAKWIPVDKLLIETDCPWLTPVPHRAKRNEPIYVRYVAEKIAEIKGIPVDEVIEISGNNAIKLFNLK